jgi:hypothetical protein
MESLKVLFPENNIEERSYIVRFMLQTLLGVQIEIIPTNEVENYVIAFPNQKEIIIEDHFFSKHVIPLSYLNADNLPIRGGDLNAFNTSYPFIFGRDFFSMDENKIYVGADIFASAFFMLSRWEEYIIGREKDGDCDENALFVVRNGLYHRPIVHEYESFFRKCFEIVEMPICCTRKFSVRYTLDVDNFKQVTWKGVFRFCRGLLHQKKYRNVVESFANNTIIKIFTANKTRLFRAHIKRAKKFSIKNEFFFKCCDNGEFGATYTYYDPSLKSIKQLLGKNNSIIGFHPSENTFLNDKQFETEFSRFNKAFLFQPIGRNHTLKYNSNTIHLWEKKGFETISNCGFHKLNGFRAGIAMPFPVFDVYQRKKTGLNELPFQIMDVAISKVHNNMFDAWDEIEKIIDVTKRHYGILCINWHIIVYFSIRNLFQSLKLVNRILNYCYD